MVGQGIQLEAYPSWRRLQYGGIGVMDVDGKSGPGENHGPCASDQASTDAGEGSEILGVYRHIHHKVQRLPPRPGQLMHGPALACARAGRSARRGQGPHPSAVGQASWPAPCPSRACGPETSRPARSRKRGPHRHAPDQGQPSPRAGFPALRHGSSTWQRAESYCETRIASSSSAKSARTWRSKAIRAASGASMSDDSSASTH